jgi:hypothetical protein
MIPSPHALEINKLSINSQRYVSLDDPFLHYYTNYTTIPNLRRIYIYKYIHNFDNLFMV